jgi:hypothetical protein
MRPRIARRGTPAAVLVAVLLCLVASAAHGAAPPAELFGAGSIAVDHDGGRVYWSNNTNADPEARISYVGLDGTAAGGLNLTGAFVHLIGSIAFDPVGRRIYWDDFLDDTRISFAKVDGTGGGELNTAGASHVSNGDDIAIDPGGRRVYWSASFAIESADLNGGGAAVFSPTPSLFARKSSLALDLAGRRIYFSDFPDGQIATAKLADGTDAHLVAIRGVALGTVHDLALDAGQGRLYWSDESGKIFSANLDGSDGREFLPSGSSAVGTRAIDIDSVGRRIYWVTSDTIRSANLDGSDERILFSSGGGPLPLHLPVIDDAPPSSTPLRDADLLYHAVDDGTTLVCQLDELPPSPCVGRSSYHNLALGRHCFFVRERGSGQVGPATPTCWTVTELAAGCSASFHHGYFIKASTALLGRRRVVFHARTDARAGEIALTTTTRGVVHVTYLIDGQPHGSGAATTLAFADVDRTRSHTLVVDIRAGGRRARIRRGFRYVSYVSVACGSRQVVGRIAPRTVTVGRAHVRVSAQVPREIRGTDKLRFLVRSDRPGALRNVRFTFEGKPLHQHARSIALTEQQLAASQTLTIVLVPRRGRSIPIRIRFRTRLTS